MIRNIWSGKTQYTGYGVLYILIAEISTHKKKPGVHSSVFSVRIETHRQQYTIVAFN